VEGLAPAASIELDVGETFRRYSAQPLELPFVRVSVGEEEGPPPVQWIAVLLTFVLAGGGLLAFRAQGPRTPSSSPATRDARQTLLVQLARLDEDFEGKPSPSAAATSEYQRRRAELLQRLKSGG
jgi:hypothetical protein